MPCVVLGAFLNLAAYGDCVHRRPFYLRKKTLPAQLNFTVRSKLNPVFKKTVLNLGRFLYIFFTQGSKLNPKN